MDTRYALGRDDNLLKHKFFLIVLRLYDANFRLLFLFLMLSDFFIPAQKILSQSFSSLNDENAFFITPQYYGAVADGTHDDTKAMQDAINSGKPVFLPQGNYRITNTIWIPSKTTITGSGRDKTIINSEVIGASTFSASQNEEIINLNFSKFTLNGINKRGVEGSGHAFNLIHPMEGGGWTPQNCIFENIEINNFKGKDIRERGCSEKISSCAIIVQDGIDNVFRDLFINGCGHGIFCSNAGMSKIEDCVIYDCDKFGVLVYNTDNLVIDKCNLLHCGDGTQDNYKPLTFPVGTGTVLSFENKNFKLINSRIKNNNRGDVLVRSVKSVNELYDGNMFKTDGLTVNSPRRAIFLNSSFGATISNNLFMPINNGFETSFDVEQIHVFNYYGSIPQIIRIIGNTFMDVSGQTVNYNILIEGRTSKSKIMPIIMGNTFGSWDGLKLLKGKKCIVKSDIRFLKGFMVGMNISNNVHVAADNVIRYVGIESLKNVTFDKASSLASEIFSPTSGFVLKSISGITEKDLNIINLSILNN